MANKVQEIAKKIEQSIPEISILAADAEVLANNNALGDITRRIFNEGKRADGAAIGPYTNDQYKRRRSGEGLQINYVDLQFSGDLFGAVNVGTLNGKPAVGITNQDSADIAAYNEKRYGTIFSATDEERRVSMETAREFMFEGIKKIVRSWS